MPQIVCNIVDLYVYRIREGRPEFLVLRRSPGRRLGGTWQSVHGRIEPGETAWQAALRELEEETGLRPERFHQIDSVNTFYAADEDTIHHCPSFAALVPAEAPIRLNEEHDAFEWLEPDAVIERFIWPGLRRGVTEVVQEVINGAGAKAFLEIPLE